LDNFLFFAILSGAACHVTWNILLKKSKDKVLFTRAFTLVASIFFIPVLFFVESLPPAAYSFFIITLIIHTLYKFFLCRVYDNSELSYGYPLARGTPSLIVLFVTPLIFSDELTISNIFSVSVLCFGIILLIFADSRFKKINLKGLSYALLVALMIAIYTIVDALGSRASDAIVYLIYYFAFDGIIFNLLAILFLKNSNLSLSFFKKYSKEILISAILASYSYFPAVYGFTVAKVATVASLRETSILFASLYGVFILKEKIGILGFLSSCLIFAGVVLIKLYG